MVRKHPPSHWSNWLCLAFHFISLKFSVLKKLKKNSFVTKIKAGGQVSAGGRQNDWTNIDGHLPVTIYVCSCCCSTIQGILLEQ